MKVIVSRPALAAMIGKIQGIVSNKPPLPILANILLEARDGNLLIVATDLTIGMCAQVEASVSEEGALTLPAHRFFQLVRELTTTEITIEAVGKEAAKVQSGSSYFRLCGMHKSEFPALPNLGQARAFTIEAKILKEVLSHSIFAAAREDSRHILNGVLMRLEGKEAAFVGTDGKRLAKLSAAIDGEEHPRNDYVIPLKAVAEIIKFLGEEEVATVKVLPDKIGIESGAIFLVTQLIPGEFPDVERIIPEKSAFSVEIHREELMTLLRQIALFTPDRGHSVQFSFKEGELKVSATSSDIGEGEVLMPVDYRGDQLDIAFNPLFFHDILRHCRHEIVSLSLTDPYTPGLITDGTGAKFVLMPMRLQAPVA